MEFSNQTALITGGSRGIGKDIAKKLASRGAYVLINYISNSQAAEETLKEIEQEGARAGRSALTSPISTRFSSAWGNSRENSAEYTYLLTTRE